MGILLAYFTAVWTNRSRSTAGIREYRTDSALMLTLCALQMLVLLLLLQKFGGHYRGFGLSASVRDVAVL